MPDSTKPIGAKAWERAQQAKDVIPFEQNLLSPDQGLQLRIAEALERIAGALERQTLPFGQMQSTETVVTGWPPHIDCGCPANHTCMNTACPRMVRVTS